MRIICVCGTRPNFIKIAPLLKVLKKEDHFETFLIHTGQHYDVNMSKLFFDELDIQKPDINLEVGSGTQATQTANIMLRFEPVVCDFKPDFVLVVGDVNSTIACGLVAVKLGVKLIHVEAGLRSFDRSMPEEINRILTDAISDLLLVSEPSGIENLKREGINPQNIFLVGNLMIDTLNENRQKAKKSDIMNRFNIKGKEYCLITLHRPSNVDDIHTLTNIFKAFEVIEKETKLIFPIHPRTRNNIVSMGLQNYINKMKNILLIDPVGYLDFLCLMSNAALVMTDSGGIQEEAPSLGVPVLVMRDSTERPEGVEAGIVRLVGTQRARIVHETDCLLRDPLARQAMTSLANPYGDGMAAKRIVAALLSTGC